MGRLLPRACVAAWGRRPRRVAKRRGDPGDARRSAAARVSGRPRSEEPPHDAGGEPLTTTPNDDAVPKASSFAPFATHHTPPPSPSPRPRAKRTGVAATIGATPTVASAVVDTLFPRALRHLAIPCTAETVWHASRQAGGEEARALDDREPRPSGARRDAERGRGAGTGGRHPTGLGGAAQWPAQPAAGARLDPDRRPHPPRRWLRPTCHPPALHPASPTLTPPDQGHSARADGRMRPPTTPNPQSTRGLPKRSGDGRQTRRYPGAPRRRLRQEEAGPCRIPCRSGSSVDQRPEPSGLATRSPC